MAVLLARCSIEPNPVLSQQLRKLPLYKLQLTASAWQRVLDELILSGLLGGDLNGFTDAMLGTHLTVNHKPASHLESGIPKNAPQHATFIMAIIK